jgi:membrane protein YqaA with SNARE-associated domain
VWWHYLLVFLGSITVDILPIPLPPAFTVMVSLQIMFGLNIWVVIALGVTGSIIGRYLLTLYIPYISDKIFRPAKIEDVQYLGQQMEKKKWSGMGGVLLYSLLPLPTTPLFIASGMARLRPLFVILPFTIGKTISDTAAVLMGTYAAENAGQLAKGLVSWKSVTGLIAGLLLVMAFVFIDWRALLQRKRLRLRFDIFRRKASAPAA